jgi:hypothetical protein
MIGAMRWFLFLLAAWVGGLVLLWIFGSDGLWMTWTARAFGAVSIGACSWWFVIRAGSDD